MPLVALETEGWLNSVIARVVPPGPGILIPGHAILIIIKPAFHGASLGREQRAFPKIINGLRRNKVTNDIEVLKEKFILFNSFSSLIHQVSTVC